MRTYIIRRLLLIIPILVLVSFMVFFLVRLIPGNVIDLMMSHSEEVVIDRDAMMRTFGLDAPLLVQYGRWMGVIAQVDGSFSGIVQGDLGTSWWTGLSLLELLASKWPVTLELSFMGLIVAQLIALPVGVYSALRQDTWGDYAARSFAIACISIPGFWLGTLVILFPSLWWNYMPPLMLIHFTEDPIGNLKMFIVPAIILGMALSGTTMRMTRTMMLEVLRQDYIRTAWAKGLGERIVVIRHAVKNALIPVITIIGLHVAILIGGTVIIEQIFMLPGMGRLLIGACLERDYPLISGIVFVFTVILVLVNLAVDLTYTYLDPRVRYK